MMSGITLKRVFNRRYNIKKFMLFLFLTKLLKNLYNSTTIMKSKVESDYHIE